MKQEKIVISLSSGEVHIRFRDDLAPKHVTRIKQLASEGFYDNCPFHRVIDNFMAQTGDGIHQDGTGGSDYPDLASEFSNEKHVRGTASMARAQHPHSANSQFFICTTDCPHLDGQYTIWGHVTQGLELIDGLKKGLPGSGMVANPDRMLTVKVVETEETS